MKPRHVFFLLILNPMLCFGELKSMAIDDMDSILSNTGEFTKIAVKQHTTISANFDVGSSNGRLSTCTNKKPRKASSFYPCWNHQSHAFYSKLNYSIKKESINNHKLKTQFIFDLNKNGSISNIKIKGISDPASKSQLERLLKEMEFGYSNTAGSKVSMNIVLIVEPVNN
ncbi:hypothetical protein ACU6U9_13775 [Pseudomonas sp. HK3]